MAGHRHPRPPTRRGDYAPSHPRGKQRGMGVAIPAPRRPRADPSSLPLPSAGKGTETESLSEPYAQLDESPRCWSAGPRAINIANPPHGSRVSHALAISPLRAQLSTSAPPSTTVRAYVFDKSDVHDGPADRHVLPRQPYYIPTVQDWVGRSRRHHDRSGHSIHRLWRARVSRGVGRPRRVRHPDWLLAVGLGVVVDRIRPLRDLSRAGPRHRARRADQL